MSDLFDGVKPPREPREEPQAAPAPAAPAAPAAKPEERQGVPVARLWGWAAPLLAVVAAIVLWSISVWLLLVVAAAAALGGLVTALAWWWRRRRRTGQGRSWPTGPTGRPARTGRGGGIARSLGLGGRTGGRGTGGRRTGSRWNPLKGASGRGRSNRPGTAGQAAGTDGHRGRAGRGGRRRSWFGTGRRSSGETTGRSREQRSASGTGRKGRGGHGGGSKGTGSAASGAGRWSRSRANPATWWGPRRELARAARKSERRRQEKARRDKDAKQDTKAGDAKRTDTAKDGKRRWWPWRRKKHTDPAEETKADDSKEQPKKKTPAKKPKKTKPAEDKKPKDADSKEQKRTEQATAKARPQEDFAFDDMGFPSNPAPPRTPTPRRQPRPLNVDDGGFISPPVRKTPKPKAPKATKQHPRSTAMSDRTANTAATQIDTSTPETFRASTQAAADRLRADADLKEEEAADLRRQAQAWIEKDLPDAAEPLLAEAARLEDDATQRRQAAAAYEAYTK